MWTHKSCSDQSQESFWGPLFWVAREELDRHGMTLEMNCIRWFIFSPKTPMRVLTKYKVIIQISKKCLQNHKENCWSSKQCRKTLICAQSLVFILQWCTKTVLLWCNYFVLFSLHSFSISTQQLNVVYLCFLSFFFYNPSQKWQLSNQFNLFWTSKFGKWWAERVTYLWVQQERWDMDT